MNAHFTRLVKANERLREFNFRKLPSPSNNLFHVDVSDDRGNRIIFKMLKEEGHWKILEETLPQWIYAAEEKLGAELENPE